MLVENFLPIFAMKLLQAEPKAATAEECATAVAALRRRQLSSIERFASGFNANLISLLLLFGQ